MSRRTDSILIVILILLLLVFLGVYRKAVEPEPTQPQPPKAPSKTGEPPLGIVK